MRRLLALPTVLAACALVPARAAAADRPRVWAVVVGIDAYPDSRIPPCPKALEDAQAIQRWLTDRQRGGWPPANVLRMTPTSQRQHFAPTQALSDLYPSRENLSWALREWLRARLQPNDIVLIAWFGQAAGLPPRPDAKPDAPGRSYLLPIDAQAHDLDRTGWAIENDLDRIAASGRNPVVIWLDTALSGRARPTVADPPPAARWLATLTRWPSVSVWLAADRQPAVEGVFRTALLDGLGPPGTSRNLLACLDRLNRDPALAAQGFRSAGGLPVDLTLRQSDLAPLGTAPPEIVLQHGHADRVLDLAVLPDGTTAATASADSTVKLWRLDDRTLLRTFADHTIGVTTLALSRNGRRLVSGDGQGRVLTFALPGLGLLEPRIARPHTAPIAAIAFTDDGNTFASLDAAGNVFRWDVSGTAAVPTKLAEQVNALACGAGRIVVSRTNPDNISNLQVFDADGKPAGTILGPGGIITARGLALRERLLAVGDKEGRVLVWDLAAHREMAHFDLGSTVTAVQVAGTYLAVGTTGAVRLLPLDQRDEGTTLPVVGTIDRLAVSPDGRWLAATTETGALHAWRGSDQQPPRKVEVPSEDEVRATALGFGPGGRTLIVGCQTGEVRTFDLDDGLAPPPIPAHRGQIAALAVAPDGHELLQITLDGQAHSWNLHDGRSLLPIPGLWTAGLFLPDGATLALIDMRGEVVLVDRASRRRNDVVLQRPVTAAGAPSRAAFRALAVSPDGRRLAAGAATANLACVWDLASGRLLRTLREHPDGVNALAFSKNANALLTSGPDGIVNLWPLEGDGLPAWSIAAGLDNPVTAALLDPNGLRWVVTGHADGTVLRWDRADGGPARSTRLAKLEGTVRALVVTADAAYLAAAGDDKFVRVVALNGPPRPPLRLDPRHHERINALVAFPGSPVIASGSEDTTIRLWRLGTDPALLGTLAASPETGAWIAYTPAGRFDSSPGGERQVTWLRDGRALPIELFYENYRSFHLTEYLRRGENHPVATAYRTLTPPALALDPPPTTTARREVELTVTLGEPDLTHLRLYLNGVPVGDGAEDFRPDPANPNRLQVTAPLRKGTNTLYVMAGRATPGSIDGRSNVVEIRCDAPETSGRLHVLALGVDHYPNRPLKFSAKDAQTLARFLHAHQADPAGPSEALVRVLENNRVDPANVRRELAAIRAAARPEDTVVIFLAGHTDVREDPVGRERFCLLLPSFPFEKPRLGQPNGLRGPGDGLQPRRGRADPPGSVLPYAAIYQYLARMPALQRLVVLDACSAEAAIEDPTVRRMQQNVADKLDDAAHRARTTYLVASRRNEPSFEDPRLGHGLLTYLLLRGMGAQNLAPLPELPLPTADANDDGIITTVELRAFVDEHLPRLAARIAPAVMRAGPNTRPDASPDRPQPLHVQAAAEDAFPLVRVPEEAPR